MLPKLAWRQATMKQTLLLQQGNGNLLKDILGINDVPSPATVSRLSRIVETIVQPMKSLGRLVISYTRAKDSMVGHLGIDRTTIEAREKPFKAAKPKKREAKKRGCKKNGSVEQKQYLKEKAQEELRKAEYLLDPPEKSIGELEMRCSLTAKQNAKGKRQWFIGYYRYRVQLTHGYQHSPTTELDLAYP